MSTSKVESDRTLLLEAQSRGPMATLGAFTQLSGPGWLQSAITLGGGSLSGALFLGVLGGFSMLWLQLVAIAMGVIMLSAISYVTLSTGKRPFRAINQHINPVLGWGWLIATCLANLIWCMPQFSLAYAAIQKNLAAGSIPDTNNSKFAVSIALLLAASLVVLLSARRGLAAKIFDIILKLLVGLIVVCFAGVVAYLLSTGKLQFAKILSGFVPDLSQWTQPAGTLTELVQRAPEHAREFWRREIVQQQRGVMIAAAATAVGINMTFLLPYSMLNRGWDKPFRGLARFDLLTGMAIPYILVTSCVVIAAAASFHGQADELLLSDDPKEIQESPVFQGAMGVLSKRLELDDPTATYPPPEPDWVSHGAASLSQDERRLAAAVVKRNAFQLSQSLAPLLGERTARLVFGLGVFGMGFSTIIILMLINGYAVCEMFGRPQGGICHAIGCLIAGVVGALWPLVWSGNSQFWLSILASVFGMMLLPIAYITFFMMMNSRAILGPDMPRGGKRLAWNLLMAIAVAGALVAAGSAIFTKATDPTAGPVVIGLAIVYGLAVLVGFALVKKARNPGAGFE